MAKRALWSSGCLGTAMLACAPAALAQTSSPVPPPAGSGSQLEEVIVTAQKRPENVQTVPISVTAISASELRQRGTDNIRDLRLTTPNVTYFGQNDSQPDIQIRGISTEARNIGFESGLGVYVDGVYQGRPEAATQALEDVERVEVLRGPQGTLFGKNTTAGAISVTTVQPTDDWTVRGLADIGERGRLRLSATVAGPVSPGVGVKLSAFSDQHDGYVKNVGGLAPDRLNDQDEQGVRGELRLRPNDRLEISLRADYAREIVTATDEEVGAVIANPLGVPLDTVVPGVRTVSVNGANGGSRIIDGGSVTASYRLADFTLTSISAYRYNSFRAATDLDYALQDYLSGGGDRRTRQITQELRIASPEGRRLTYVAGLYYFDQTSSAAQRTSVGTDFEALLGLDDTTRDDISTRSRVGTTSYAAFANGTLQIVGRLKLIGGLRYTYEEKTLDASQGVAAPLLEIGLPYADFAPARDRLTDHDVSPTIGLTYDFTPTIFGYVRYSEGFKSGGWNSELFLTGSLPDVRFLPESIKNYEAGIRAELLGRRLRLNLTGFVEKYDDIQISQFVGGVLGFRTTNAGQATSKGFELEAVYRPLAGLTLSGNVGLADARYDHFADAGGPGVDLDGYRLNAPKWTVNTSVAYERPLAKGFSLISRIDYAYQSARPGDGLDPYSRIPGFDTVDARVGIGSAAGWEAVLYAENLLNRDTLVSRYDITNLATLGIEQLAQSYAPPRTFGLRLSYRR